MAEFDYQELVKATDNFNPTRIIGKGSHGMVYKGLLHKDNKLVAVKKPSQGLQSLHDNSKLENEIRVLSSLRENPHVLKLLGTSHDSLKNKVIVMELLPNGSLHDWLHASKTPPSWPRRVEIAKQIARSVQFLHEGKPLVIHRDIKSTNILFDSQWNAKLADFGLAVIGVVEPLSQPAGTIGYIDPCYTTPSKLSTKNDMFSFGVVLLEIISGRKAIDVCKTPASIVEWAIPLIEQQPLEEICDARMVLPAYMAGTIKHFLREAARCVSPSEGDRPSAGEVVMGMESCFVGRVRYPFWTSVLKSVVRLRKRRKLVVSITSAHPQTRTQGEGEVDVDVDGDGDTRLSSGKISMTIREVLADVTLR